MKVQEIAGEGTLRQPKQKKKRKPGRRLFLFKLFFSFILVSGVVVLLALSPIFTIKSIEVQGSSHYKGDYLAGLTGIALESNGFRSIGNNVGNIFTLRYGAAEDIILNSCPYIRSVKVKFLPPSKVGVFVAERQPVGRLSFLGSNLIMDVEGYVLEKVDKLDNLSLTELKGLRFDRYEPGKKLQLENPEALNKLKELAEGISSSDQSDNFKLAGIIKAIDIRDIKKITFLVDNRITVNFGDLQDLDYRIAFLKQIIQKNLKKDDRGVLDFSQGENPGFVPEIKK